VNFPTIRENNSLLQTRASLGLPCRSKVESSTYSNHCCVNYQTGTLETHSSISSPRLFCSQASLTYHYSKTVHQYRQQSCVVPKRFLILEQGVQASIVRVPKYSRTIETLSDEEFKWQKLKNG